MKHTITLTNADGTEIKLDTGTKITVQDMLVGEDAVYGTIYKGVIITDFNVGVHEITLKVKSDCYETILKSTK